MKTNPIQYSNDCNLCGEAVFPEGTANPITDATKIIFKKCYHTMHTDCWYDAQEAGFSQLRNRCSHCNPTNSEKVLVDTTQIPPETPAHKSKRIYKKGCNGSPATMAKVVRLITLISLLCASHHESHRFLKKNNPSQIDQLIQCSLIVIKISVIPHIPIIDSLDKRTNIITSFVADALGLFTGSCLAYKVFPEQNVFLRISVGAAAGNAIAAMVNNILHNFTTLGSYIGSFNVVRSCMGNLALLRAKLSRTP